MVLYVPVFANCADEVLGPLTTVHAPVPRVGELPERVALPPQMLWVEVLVAVVGVPIIVSVPPAAFEPKTFVLVEVRSDVCMALTAMVLLFVAVAATSAVIQK